MIQLTFTKPETIIYLGVGFVVLILLLLLILKLTKKTKAIKAFELTYLNDLYEALGKKENIKALEIKQQRIQIELNNLKNVNQNLLKETEIPAFLTGRKITLLIKEHSQEVFNYLNEKRKEED